MRVQAKYSDGVDDFWKATIPYGTAALYGYLHIDHDKHVSVLTTRCLHVPQRPFDNDHFERLVDVAWVSLQRNHAQY